MNIWNVHQEDAVALDGAGMRADAEFKMCKRVLSAGKKRFKALFLFRGTIGLFLDAGVLSLLGERGMELAHGLVNIWKIRRKNAPDFLGRVCPCSCV